MLIEAAKGGHTNVVSYLLDYPNNVLSVPTADMSQLTPPSQDQSQVSYITSECSNGEQILLNVHCKLNTTYK